MQVFNLKYTMFNYISDIEYLFKVEHRTCMQKELELYMKVPRSI